MKLLITAPVTVACLAIAGCSGSTSTPNASGSSGGPTTVTVTSTDSECKVSATEAPAGPITFEVTNGGNQITEFYLLGSDGQQVVGEVEDIGPGTTRQLVVTATAGTYVANCKPGMAGDGIKVPFTVTGTASSASAGANAQLDDATEDYAGYVRTEAVELVEGTSTFATAYAAGDFATARALYAPTRVHWERIEPVAESFGDLDPKLDLREADLEPGQQWTGWHRIEKDLWPPKSYEQLTKTQRQALADQLVVDTKVLARRTEQLEYRPDQLGNGAKELMDEVATGKVTGEEEIWSHTDLYDFQANVDGAKEAYESLETIVRSREPELATTLEATFGALQELLDQYRRGSGFVSYTALTQAQVQELARAVDAVGEPLSRLTAVVVR